MYVCLFCYFYRFTCFAENRKRNKRHEQCKMANICNKIIDGSGLTIKEEPSDSDSGDSRDTVKFDLAQFPSSLSNSKYKVHKNDAELLADFNKIMDGDGEDEDGDHQMDLTQTSKQSTDISQSMDSNDLLISPRKRDVPDKADLILHWTKIQAELSTTVASIFSDHDYLSQEHLFGNINSNVKQQRLNESINKTSSDSQLSDVESISSTDMNDLKKFFNQLSTDLKSKQNRNVLKQIAAKVEKIQSRLKADSPLEQRNDTANTSNESLSESASTSTKTEEKLATEFSSNHSEPYEYYAKNDVTPGETGFGQFNYPVSIVFFLFSSFGSSFEFS